MCKKYKPIIFNTDMVRAIIDGRKTQSRRLMKPQPEKCEFDYGGELRQECFFVKDSLPCDRNHESELWQDSNGKWNDVYIPAQLNCDILYVRETFTENYSDDMPVAYKADWLISSDIAPAPKWKPSIHMPKKYARIFLKALNVRVERLNDISNDDAIKEGIEAVGGKFSCSPWRNYRIGEKGEMNLHCSAPQRSFMSLWESIYGIGSWDINPFVWVIEFEKTTGDK